MIEVPLWKTMKVQERQDLEISPSCSIFVYLMAHFNFHFNNFEPFEITCWPLNKMVKKYAFLQYISHNVTLTLCFTRFASLSLITGIKVFGGKSSNSTCKIFGFFSVLEVS